MICNRISFLSCLVACFTIYSAASAQVTAVDQSHSHPHQAHHNTDSSSKIGLPSFAPAIEVAMPAIVNISTSQKIEVRGPFEGFDFPEGSLPDSFRDMLRLFEKDMLPEGSIPRTQKAISLGSGVIIDPQGYIVTNYHVIAEAEEITVTLSNEAEKSFKAKVIGKDSKTDLALLKIETKTPLPFLKFGSSDAARVGDWIICIGNPFGLGGSVTTGIVSAKSRFIAGQYDDFLQTDASINRGSSGGPMLNLDGEVIGINSVIISPSGGNVGIGLAIPSDIVQPIVKQLREKGVITRGWLGVKLQVVTEDIAKNLDLADAKGALVAEVIKNSPSEKAGIRVGDIVTNYDGKDIGNMQKLPRLVAETPIGKIVKVELLRDGKPVTLEAKIEKPDDAEAQNDDKRNKGDKTKPDNAILGMQVESLNDANRTKYKIDKSITGVVVTKVERGSIAQNNGIKPGDAIIRINRSKIDSAADLSKAIAASKKNGASSALFLISRNGSTMFLVLDLE